ncbi:MAG: hypothetical protein A2Y15_05600 [Clostridiales bacterium GWF2_36_10]|nr:MAG: hypothetical protein A2Y15_05600 [Clostridiales bacterium GWF2_36_10]
MDLKNLKEYIDKNKSLEVAEELKQKTLEATTNKEFNEKAFIIKHNKKHKSNFKRIIAVAACLLLAVGLGTTALFSGLFSGMLKANYYENEDPLRYIPNIIVENEEINKDMIDEAYQNNDIIENPIVKTSTENISTFSIDVDTASYVNFRRYISTMSLSQFQNNKYTIRTEEAINYFNYSYDKPVGDTPIAVTTTVGDCSWNLKAKLAMITVVGKELITTEQAGSNIVFLVDVSGSMSAEDKLPLLKESLTMAIENLNEKDTVSIVTYAGGVQTILSGAGGNEKYRIIEAFNSLVSGGGTAGADGLNLAYSVANDYFIENGNNRIILATDGDFNVGPNSVEEMEQLVTQKRESGIFLSVIGFGVSYNSGDKRLEVLADNGDGGYYVIDCLDEGEKVLCDQFSSTLYTVAKDVKLQVEFNINAVESYRLIGYENRVLSNKDFENDAVDAGDLGAGQTVTALYEIVLKENAASDLFNVDVRYKDPNENESKLYSHTAQISTNLTGDFYFASAVAEACLVINNSKYKGTASLEHTVDTARLYSNGDIYKENFVKLLESVINNYNT